MRSTKGQSSIEELGQFQKFRLAGKGQDHYVWGKPFDLVCSHLGITSRYKNRTRCSEQAYHATSFLLRLARYGTSIYNDKVSCPATNIELL